MAVGETYYAIDEVIPSGITVVNPGTGNASSAGHLKWSVIQNASSTSYSYIATANTAGTYNFAGTYMAEGMTVEAAVAEARLSRLPRLTLPLLRLFPIFPLPISLKLLLI